MVTPATFTTNPTGNQNLNTAVTLTSTERDPTSETTQAPWKPGSLNQPAPGMWNVQSQNGNSTYGVDYVGLAPNQVSWMQYYDPNVNGVQSSSCAIQTTMFIQINVANSDTGQQYNTYNTQDLLIYTIGTNTYSVTRGGVTVPPRQFHQ